VRRSAKEKSDAEALAKQFTTVHLTFLRKVGDREHLFGSVTAADIAQEMEARGFNIDRRKIQLDEPLKTLGDFDVPIKLHRDVAAPIKVTIRPDTE
jgi:large subunit ribosomal protein L9